MFFLALSRYYDELEIQYGLSKKQAPKGMYSFIDEFIQLLISSNQIFKYLYRVNRGRMG